MVKRGSKLAISIILCLAIATSIFPYGCAQNIEAYLASHNEERTKTGVSELTWDDALATYSLYWANHQKDFENCAMKHSNGPYGENLFWGSPGKEWGVDEAVKSWVEEKQHFTYESNSCAAMCGHYTQVVWKDTQKVGCADVKCPNGETLVVCNYDPPGNFEGEKPF